MQYTNADFESAIAEITPQIAVFDCDGTLWQHDSGSAFMRWTMETGLLAADAVDWMNERYRRYLAGEVNELVICGEMVQVYQGIAETDLRAAAVEFFAERIVPGIFPEMERAVAHLQARGADIWAVSSTNDWVVEEGVKRFNLPANRVLAAKVTVLGGIATDQLIDVPTDEGKVAALARAGVRRPDAVFGNSIHDAAMLAIASRAFPINPSPALIERSLREGWRVYFPAMAGSI